MARLKMKYFIIADPHGFFTTMIDSLIKAGFNPEDKTHKIILCGDAFDRGIENTQMLEWIKNMLKLKKLIYIRGNHEDLLLDIIKRKQILSHDIHNGTLTTICQFISENKYDILMDTPRAIDKLKATGIIKFINNNCLDYFETQKYIFTHGYIPEGKDWRKASSEEWGKARWLNGIQEFLRRGGEPNKTIIVGHWHCNWYRDLNKKPEEQWKDFSPQFLKDELDETSEIIAMDSCTAYNGLINVLIVEDYDIVKKSTTKNKEEQKCLEEKKITIWENHKQVAMFYASTKKEVFEKIKSLGLLGKGAILV